MEGRSRLAVGGCAWIARLWLRVGLGAAVLAAAVGTIRGNDPPGCDPAAHDPADYDPADYDAADCPQEIHPGSHKIFSGRPLAKSLAASRSTPEHLVRPVVPAAAWLPAQQSAVAPPVSPEPAPLPGPRPSGAPAADASGNNSQEKEKLGTPPPDNRMEFLRRATVLLQPCQAQFDWGIDYTWQELVSPVVLTDQQLDHERLRQRALLSPFALRYGVTERLQAFVNMPVGFGFLERANAERDCFDTVFNLGDITTGVNHLLRKGEGPCPDLIGTLAFTAPTGPHPYAQPGEDAVLGTGFWNLSYDLLFVKALDPAVVLYGVGYKHYFARDFLGGVVAPGEELNYSLGVGFAVNDRLTLSTIFFGTYRPDLRFNGTGLKGTSEEPMSLRLALTAVSTNCYILEPFVRFGLTPDAPQAHLGIIVTRTF